MAVPTASLPATCILAYIFGPFPKILQSEFVETRRGVRKHWKKWAPVHLSDFKKCFWILGRGIPLEGENSAY